MTNEHSDITQVLYGDQRVKDTLSRFLSQQNGIDLCSDSRTIAQVLDIYKKESSDPGNKKEIRKRFLTDINAENIPFCKELINLSGEVRHLTGIKTNFGVRSREYISIATLKEESLQVEHRQQKKKEDDEQEQYEQSTQSQSHIICSNIKGIIEQQQCLFNSLWEKAIPAEQRIKQLEQGSNSEFFKVITDNKKISRILIDLVNSVVSELLLLLPNDKALVRIDNLGIINSLIKASQQKGVNVKIICPLSKENSQIQKKIADSAPDINILHSTNSRHGMYIVDRIKFLRIELVKPEAENFLDAIGFAVYSNNERSTELFRWMFELLWNERMVNEKSKHDDKIQDEFINIAAHELRSPAQSIFGYTELMLTDPEYKQLDKKEGYIDAIYRNSLRLTNLTAELLDISRIENQTLHLYKQEFKLNDIILSVIQDIQKQRQGQTLGVIKDSGARIMYSSKSPKPLKNEEQSTGGGFDDNNNSADIFVEADKERIIQVLINLLDNALKFTNESDAISVVVEVTEDNKSNNAEVIVRIKDSGMGIDPKILPFLFTKFCSRPSPVSRIRGSGLGLYICKWIVEAHGGRIWAYNNTHGKGATFLFSLPIPK
ncbi:MAG TPA: HAMP domain-containing sensor histidine kinase [Nitrososphaeraceae archaeon]|nr:HAMP domain-containing sensor histidine kinase [Nitrososphaeraceae archaeon]